MRQIWLVCQSSTQARELLKLASRLINSGQYKVSFIITGDVTAKDRQAIKLVCNVSHAEVVDLNTSFTAPRSKLPGRIGRLTDSARRILKKHRSLSDYLKKASPELLFVCEDGVGGELVLIAKAKSQGIPVIILPYEYSSIAQVIESFVGSSFSGGIHSPLEKWIAKKWPKWALTYEGTTYLRVHPFKVILIELARASIPLPWTVHGGNADVLLAESEAMRLHYIAEGIASSKIILTGSLSDDDVFARLTSRNPGRENATRETLLPSARKILVAFPPSYVAERKGTSEFTSYFDLVKIWVDTVEAFTNVEITFQAHPHTSKRDLETIRQRVNLSTLPITDLIFEADILITSVSSIIRTAITCLKPVINYDVYRFNYPDYQGVKGVLNVSNAIDFKKELNNLLSNPAEFDRIASAVRESADKWGVLDGMSWTRIEKVVQTIAKGTDKTFG